MLLPPPHWTFHNYPPRHVITPTQDHKVNISSQLPPEVGAQDLCLAPLNLAQVELLPSAGNNSRQLSDQHGFPSCNNVLMNVWSMKVVWNIHIFPSNHPQSTEHWYRVKQDHEHQQQQSAPFIWTLNISQPTLSRWTELTDAVPHHSNLTPTQSDSLHFRNINNNNNNTTNLPNHS